MNQIRILRLDGIQRELYIRENLMAEKKSTLVHMVASAGLNSCRSMTKIELVDFLTTSLLEWARRRDFENK